MADPTFSDFTQETAPALTDFDIGYRTPFSGGERRTLRSAVLALFKANTTPADIGAATAAQGALADSSVQPGDNITDLTNNAGFITGVAWGAITGTLSNQTDLQSALNAKQASLTIGNLTETTSSVLTVTGGTGAIIGSGLTIQVKQASGSQAGYLSSSDWTTFNAKQAAGNYVTALTGDVTATGPGSVAATLATVNGNVGTFGSATKASVVTVNAKGLVTAASESTVTPAVGSITGLGTGVATALAVNVGSAGAFVTFNGALGTPSSGTVTNLTGTASININGTVGATTPNTVAGTTGIFTGIFNISQGTASQLRIGPSAGTDTGGWITSTAANNLDITSGSKFNSSGLWVATQTDASQIHLGGGNIEFFINGGLTIGNTFTITRQAYFAGNQLFMNTGGAAATPSYSGDNGQTTGMWITPTPGVAFGVSGVGQAQIETNKFYPTTDNALDLGDTSHRFKNLYVGTGATIGIGGTGSTNAILVIDAGSTSGFGAAIRLNRNSVVKWQLGHESGIIGNNSDAFILYDQAASAIGLKYTTATGLAVTGTLTVAGASTFAAISGTTGTFSGDITRQAANGASGALNLNQTGVANWALTNTATSGNLVLSNGFGPVLTFPYGAGFTATFAGALSAQAISGTTGTFSGVLTGNSMVVATALTANSAQALKVIARSGTQDAQIVFFQSDGTTSEGFFNAYVTGLDWYGTNGTRYVTFRNSGIENTVIGATTPAAGSFTTLSATGDITGPGSTYLLKTSAALTNYAAAQIATITNGPTAGNPTKWVAINDNGTVRYLPLW